MARKNTEADRTYQASWRKANKETLLIKKKIYRDAHKEQMRITHAAHQIANKEHLNTISKEYHRTHKEEQNAKMRARHAAKKDELNAKGRAYRAEHPETWDNWAQAHKEEMRARVKARRALIRGAAISDLSAPQWQEIQAAYDHRCVYCGRRAKGHLTQDHITPLSQGGNHTISNVVPACLDCNLSKKDNPPPRQVQPLLITVAQPKIHRRSKKMKPPTQPIQLVLVPAYSKVYLDIVLRVTLRKRLRA